MSLQIPITFDFEGRSYSGFFSSVSGGGGSTYHLMIADYYYGQLTFSSAGWQFTSNKNWFIGMSEYFGDYISAWLDGQAADEG